MIPDTKNAQFYFANFGADIMRCVLAVKQGDAERYENSLARAKQTLSFLHDIENKGAYKEGKLLIQALEYAREGDELDKFSNNLNKVISSMSMFQGLASKA